MKELSAFGFQGLTRGLRLCPHCSGMLEALLIGGLFVLLLLAGIAFTMRATVLKMLAAPGAAEIPAAMPEMDRALPESFRRLLEAEGFEFWKAYSFHATRFGVWIKRSPAVPLRSFCLMRTGGKTSCEFGTDFSDDVSLTTTRTNAAFVFPHIHGKYGQAFPKMNAEELWQAHRRGEEYITSVLGVRAEECRLPFLESLQRGISRRMKYVMSHRLWYVRGIYWYLVKRFRLQSQPIWTQDLKKIYGRDE